MNYRSHQDDVIGEQFDDEEILSILTTDQSSRILEAASRRPLSAREIADRCEVSPSTVYRHAEELNEAGLLEERVRIDRGTNPKCFATTPRWICLRFDEGRAEVALHDEVGPRDS